MKRLNLFATILVLIFIAIILSVTLVTAQQNQIHVVQVGDTLQRIATVYSVTVAQIQEANGLGDSTAITPGQVLTIPSGVVINAPQAPTATPTPVPPPSPTPIPGQQTHLVEIGDTLHKLATQYGVTIEAIVNVNRLVNRNRILAGQTLIIPPPGVVVPPPPPAPGTPGSIPLVPNTVAYVLRNGDSLGVLAATYQTTVQAIMDLNGITNTRRIFPGQVIYIPYFDAPNGILAPDPVRAPKPAAPQPPPAPRTHVVQPNETLFGIATWYGVDVYALARANNIYNINLIYAWQTLIIPPGW